MQTLPEELRESRDEATTRTGEASTSTTTHRAAVPAVNQAVAGASARSKDRADVDEAYFDSYSFFDIHREMLEDKTRTGSYRCVKLLARTCFAHRRDTKCFDISNLLNFDVSVRLLELSKYNH